MASIQKRGKKYAVIYTYEDSTQAKRQKWESFTTKKEALARKAQVENEINNGTFIPPSNVTVAEFLKDFVELYGSKRWGLSAYSGNTGLIDNYINPILGEYNIQDINRRVVDHFILELQKTAPVNTQKGFLGIISQRTACRKAQCMTLQIFSIVQGGKVSVRALRNCVLTGAVFWSSRIKRSTTRRLMSW